MVAAFNCMLSFLKSFSINPIALQPTFRRAMQSQESPFEVLQGSRIYPPHGHQVIFQGKDTLRDTYSWGREKGCRKMKSKTWTPSTGEMASTLHSPVIKKLHRNCFCDKVAHGHLEDKVLCMVICARHLGTIQLVLDLLQIFEMKGWEKNRSFNFSQMWLYLHCSAFVLFEC